MNAFAQLLEQQPVVFLHVASAAGALALGPVLLLRRKGTAGHRRLGWTWVLLMAATAISSAFILDHRLPNIAGFTPIHAFTVLVAVRLPQAIWHIRHGNVQAHRHAMRGLFTGACLIAGLFALLPGRFLGDLVWRQALDWVA